MGPDFWTAFTFFGIPLVVGLLGVARGVGLCYRVYRQYTSVLGPDQQLGQPPGQRTTEADETDESERTWRGNLTIGLVLVVGAGLLVAHSGRWLLRIL